MTNPIVTPVTSLSDTSKTAQSENFPVASLFLARNVRKEVMSFYNFARIADDIADSPHMESATKKDILKGFQSETDNPYLKHLLRAFIMDCDKNRYEDWHELLEYCKYSANPVGRFLLDVHGDLNNQSIYASDALCTVLQILNHLQDCQKDYLKIDRIYLPNELLEEGQSYDDLLRINKTHKSLQVVFDHCHVECQKLINQSLILPDFIRSSRLRFQAKMTIHCAQLLLDKLKANDPLATRVELSRYDKALILFKGVWK